MAELRNAANQREPLVSAAVMQTTTPNPSPCSIVVMILLFLMLYSELVVVVVVVAAARIGDLAELPKSGAFVMSYA